MAYHVMALTLQDIKAGKARIPEKVLEEAVRRMEAIPRQVQAGVMHREEMEVLALTPLHPHFQELGKKYGENAKHILFFNDAAKNACDMFGFNPEFSAVIDDDELPADLGVAMRMLHGYILSQ